MSEEFIMLVVGLVWLGTMIATVAISTSLFPFTKRRSFKRWFKDFKMKRKGWKR